MSVTWMEASRASRAIPSNRVTYPALPDRFLWEELSLQVARAADVLATSPDLSELVETPRARAPTDLASQTHQLSFARILVNALTCRPATPTSDPNSTTPIKMSVTLILRIAFVSTGIRNELKAD